MQQYEYISSFDQPRTALDFSVKEIREIYVPTINGSQIWGHGETATWQWTASGENYHSLEDAWLECMFTDSGTDQPWMTAQPITGLIGNATLRINGYSVYQNTDPQTSDLSGLLFQIGCSQDYISSEGTISGSGTLDSGRGANNAIGTNPALNFRKRFPATANGVIILRQRLCEFIAPLRGALGTAPIQGTVELTLSRASDNNGVLFISGVPAPGTLTVNPCLWVTQKIPTKTSKLAIMASQQLTYPVECEEVYRRINSSWGSMSCDITPYGGSRGLPLAAFVVVAQSTAFNSSVRDFLAISNTGGSAATSRIQGSSVSVRVNGSNIQETPYDFTTAGTPRDSSRAFRDLLLTMRRDKQPDSGCALKFKATADADPGASWFTRYPFFGLAIPAKGLLNGDGNTIPLNVTVDTSDAAIVYGSGIGRGPALWASPRRCAPTGQGYQVVIPSSTPYNYVGYCGLSF